MESSGKWLKDECLPSEKKLLNSVFQVFQATGGDKGNRKQMTNALIMMFLPSIAKALKLEMFDRVSLNPLFSIYVSFV